MGFHVTVLTSSDVKNDIIKKLGADKIINWVKGEHFVLKNQFTAILNTLPCDISEE